MKDQPTLTCKDEQRRQKVRVHNLKGLDYIELSEDQRTLTVYFLGKAPPELFPEKGEAPAVYQKRMGKLLRVEGGRRIRGIRVENVEVRNAGSEDDDSMVVKVDKAGDFSTYKLCLVATEDGRPTGKPFPDFDPRYACAEFCFKVGCPSDLDCKPEAVCPPPKRDEPEINYLAKDYASFRQLILDRLALIMPEWQERQVPDIGVALVEVLAYVGDHLSYYQDAVATEAYLDTARQRISIRRHARLVDYPMHEGCNARTWVTVWTDHDMTDGNLKLQDMYFTTAIGDTVPEVFEPLMAKPDADLKLYVAHNEIPFYTWGNEECCLPRGATTATLNYDWKSLSQSAPKQAASHEQSAQASAGHCEPDDPKPAVPEIKLPLQAGDILIFEEVKGPKTGNPADADPTRRWAVRLTKVSRGMDTLYDPAIPIVDIEWSAEDALPFPFCLSARRPAPDCDLVYDISVARGNVILVDHGRTIDADEDLGQVGKMETVGDCACEGSVLEMPHVPEVFRPDPLKQAPLTFSEPLRRSVPASVMLNQDPRKALPQVLALKGLPSVCPEPGDSGKPKTRDVIAADADQWLWHPKRDLLESQSQDQHFVVEMDNVGGAHLRFGDGELGRMPEACMIFTARYRVGNGLAGNVGADTITTAVFRHTILSGVSLRPRNPLPARGGTAPEPMSEVKLFAPGVFRKELQRAIIADDYARLAVRNVKVQRAGASLRWTGSWYAAQVAVDPLGSETADKHLLHEIKGYLYRYRRMGHDLEVWQAKYVPLEIELQVCVLPHYLRGHVEAALLEVFSQRVLPDGRLGFFHPDNLTFGEGIYLSKLVAAAQTVTGVESVRLTKLERLYEGPNHEIEFGILPLGPLEVAQLDNDPSFPEHGRLTLTMGGGR